MFLARFARSKALVSTMWVVSFLWFRGKAVASFGGFSTGKDHAHMSSHFQGGLEILGPVQKNTQVLGVEMMAEAHRRRCVGGFGWLQH